MQRDREEMMGFCIEFGYDGGRVDRSVVRPGDLGVLVKLESVREWVGKQDWEGILGME